METKEQREKMLALHHGFCRKVKDLSDEFYEELKKIVEENKSTSS